MINLPFSQFGDEGEFDYIPPLNLGQGLAFEIEPILNNVFQQGPASPELLRIRYMDLKLHGQGKIKSNMRWPFPCHLKNFMILIPFYLICQGTPKRHRETP
jgi:hypothetical protein